MTKPRDIFLDTYRDVITSDELKEFIEELDEAREISGEEIELRKDAKRLLEEYGDDFVIIRYSYAADYVEDFVRDCYSIPKELDWLFYHIDWDGVIRDFRMGGDWAEDEFGGITYYVEVR